MPQLPLIASAPLYKFMYCNTARLRKSGGLITVAILLSVLFKNSLTEQYCHSLDSTENYNGLSRRANIKVE